MSDMVAKTPLSGPTLYDFGQATPGDWPRSYVAEDDYRELLKRIETLERDRSTAESENETLRSANREFALNEAKTRSGWFLDRIKTLETGLRVIGGWAMVAGNMETFRKVKTLLPSDFTADGGGEHGG